ncbi:MAG: response regulator transcription factor [Cyanobacteria bacterium P01_F01_bin.53]
MDSQWQLPQWRVLIIEDDPLVQLGIEQALAACSELTVLDIIDDGYLAVEAAMQHTPELVLMDIGLPGIDGIETTRQIKTKLPDTKIIMLTSHTTETEVLASFSSGAEAYCIKGGSIDVLLTAIATVAQGGVYLDAQIAQIVVQSFQATPEPKEAVEHNLSERELEVLNLLVEGLSNPAIAKRLYISPNTVKAHMRGLMNKLEASDRVQVAVKALRAGLV